LNEQHLKSITALFRPIFVGLLVVSGIAIAVFAMPNPQERTNGPTAVPGQPQQSPKSAIFAKPGSVGRRYSAERPSIARRQAAPQKSLLAKPLPAAVLPAQPGSKIATGTITRLEPRLVSTEGRHPRTPKSAVQRTAVAGTITKAGVAPIIRGVVKPMAGVRVLSPAPIPLARSKERELEIIATRVQGRKPSKPFRPRDVWAAFWSRMEDTAN